MEGNFKVETIGKWKAGIMFDEEENIYTIFYAGNGGGIISDRDKELAKVKFIEAMEVAEAVKKLVTLTGNKPRD